MKIYSANVDGSDLTRISYVNQQRLNQLAMNDIETFTTKGAGGNSKHNRYCKTCKF
ncbi:MAG: hypothetical protein IPJ75_09630 [Ignavibacteriales bacterium]|nr:hypothetical protein [Ignavibacteriales bacterium]